MENEMAIYWIKIKRIVSAAVWKDSTAAIERGDPRPEKIVNSDQELLEIGLHQEIGKVKAST